MRYLLDTHTLIWWLLDLSQLKTTGRTILSSQDSDVFVSAGSVWEIATKWRIGKLREIVDPQVQIPDLMRRNGFHSLPVTDAHAMRAGLLEGEHRDPFDRIIAAQALCEEMIVISRDPKIAAFGCAVMW